MANIKNFGLVGIGSNVQFGKGGSQIVSAGGAFAAKSSDGNAFVRFQVATPTDAADAATKAFVDSAVGDVQDAVDAVRTGAGLGEDGSYTANATATYISAAVSLKDADDKLDAAIAAVQSELNATQTGAGLNADGSYTAGSQNYITAATSLANALALLDAALKAEENRAKAAEGAIQTGAGLSETGAYEANEETNYIADAVSLKDADEKLDAAIKGVADDLAAVEGSYIKKDGSVAFTGDINAGSHKLTNLATPTDAADAATKGYVDSKVQTLGNAFNYVGTVAGGTEESPTDLSELTEKDSGDYYKVETSGYFTYDGLAEPFFASAGDGLVKNITADGWDKIDNTDSNVAGTTGFIAVTGSADTGFTVDIDSAFKTRVSDVETDLGDLAVEVDAVETAVGLNADGTKGNYSTTNYIANADSILTAVGKLDAALKAEENRAKAAEGAIQTGAGLSETGAYEANEETNYIADAVSLKDADEKLDAAIKAVADDLANLSQDEIRNGDNTVSVKAADTGIEFSVDVDGKTKVGEIVGGEDTDSAFKIDVGTAGEVRLEAASSSATDVDIRLVPQGSGHVYIGETGAGIMQAEDGFDLTIAGGDAADGAAGDLILRGGNGETQGKVRITDGAGSDVMTFEGTASATSYVKATNGSGSATLGVEGSATNADLVLVPKGTGNVSVSNARVVNVATPTASSDAATKGYVDTSVATAISGALLTRVAQVTEQTGTVNLGQVMTGTVVRVRVVVTNAFSAGAKITVGRDGTEDDLAELADDSMIDESTMGVYTIDVAKTYTATQLVVSVTAGSGTEGAAQVIVEYVNAV